MKSNIRLYKMKIPSTFPSTFFTVICKKPVFNAP